MTPEEKAKLIEQEEDEYFEAMMQAFANSPATDDQDDIEYFTNHPLNCKELTPEVMARPEFQALQSLAYDGTPEEVCSNFRDHAFEALNTVLSKQTKGPESDKLECERAMHFFNEALKTDYKEEKMLF